MKLKALVGAVQEKHGAPFVLPPWKALKNGWRRYEEWAYNTQGRRSGKDAAHLLGRVSGHQYRIDWGRE